MNPSIDLYANHYNNNLNNHYNNNPNNNSRILQPTINDYKFNELFIRIFNIEQKLIQLEKNQNDQKLKEENLRLILEILYRLTAKVIELDNKISSILAVIQRNQKV